MLARQDVRCHPPVRDRAESRVHGIASPAPLNRPAETGAGWPRTLAMGDVDVELRTFPIQRVLHLSATAQAIQVIVPVAGQAIVVLPGGTHRVAPGSALLLADRARADCTWSAGSRGLILRVSRVAVQARHIAAGGAPRRIASGVLAIHPVDPRSTLGDALATLAVAAPSSDEDGSALIAGLVEALAATPERGSIFPAVPSVRRALDRLRLDPGAATQEDLAAAAGLTLATLRRNVRECMGVTLTRLLGDARLDWVHARLQSHTEARSIGQLALATGHVTTAVLNRAYQRRFGETPTQTRARAFGRG